MPLQLIMNAKELITRDRCHRHRIRAAAGNNINQLAKYANILQKQNKYDPLILKQLNSLLRGYREIQEKLEVSLRHVIKGDREII